MNDSASNIRFLCIFASPRTGSSRLVELIRRSPDLNAKHELFHYKWIVRLTENDWVGLKDESDGYVVDDETFLQWRRVNPARALESLYESGRRKPVAFKIFAFHLQRETIKQQLLSRSDMAFALLRRTPIESYISGIKAKGAGAYTRLETTDIKPDLDHREFSVWCRQMKDWHDWIFAETDAAGHELIDFTYENDIDNPDEGEVTENIFLKLDAAGLHTVSVKPKANPIQKQDRTSRYQDRVANWDAFESAMRETSVGASLLDWAKTAPSPFEAAKKVSPPKVPWKPWTKKSENIPEIVMKPKGMIGPEERSCFYWLAKNRLTGLGCIVDAGSFLGASTLCFAAGAFDAGHKTFGNRPIVHAYDYFKAVDKYVVQYIESSFRPAKEGDSYLDIFNEQTESYRELIAAYPGDFLGHKWHGDPIEILFVDVAKSAKLNAHAIGEFFPSLIPGVSVVVHQDYFHCWHPYIHIGMEFFGDEFELLDEHVEFQSRVWQLKQELSPEKIARMRAYDLAKSERLELLDRLIDKSSTHSKPMMEVVRLWQHCIDKDYEIAGIEIDRLRSKYKIDGRPEIWFKQALRIESTLQAKQAQQAKLAQRGSAGGSSNRAG